MDTDESRVALLEGLKPPKRAHPVIAIIGENGGTETTDFLVPFGVLSRADVADVYALGTQPGPIKMMPALTIHPTGSSATFDARHPAGADYVIVPAMHNANDPDTINWIRQQAEKGAIVVGICTGAKVLGNAGLLENREATTHWYDRAAVQRANPSMRYVANKRYLVDERVASTTGITASIPFSLTLVEAIAGYAHAAELASELGVHDWGAQHDSAAFKASMRFYATGFFNTVLFWRHENLELLIEDGVDEVALGLTADAWSRTYRSKALTRTPHRESVQTLGGITIIPDRIGDSDRLENRLPSISNERPATALDDALEGISRRYGQRTAAFVALQLEYPRPKK